MDLLDDISEDENIQEDVQDAQDAQGTHGTLGQGPSPGDDLDKSKGQGQGQGQDPDPDQLDSALRQVIDTFKHRFPGVEEVLHGEQYVRWIAQQVDFHWDSPGESQSQSQESPAISPEQQLIVSTLSHRFPQGLEAPSAQELAPLQRYLEVSSALKTIHAQLTASIHLQAPNVCALVGPEIAARLVAHYGSVRELSCVPSCNLVTFGRNRQGLGQGLIYSCDIVQQQHPEFRKQAARMLCAKLVITARIDANGQGRGIADSNGPGPANADALSGAAGSKLRTQILERLQKVSTPPQLSRVKPLPVPEDKPKKKRAGKRFRKYKQQFQRSHMRQLQNRMEFGRAEHTTMDAYGEEIGMGLARVSGHELSSESSGPGPGPRPKMSKAMRKRLESVNAGPGPLNGALDPF
ncbi:pre-mRNA-processing factor 31 [Kluyveromyces marxianus]|uniref:Pre-mRNA-processing factor 31 n=1 Tax=Kluyveromyces marxianus TaxID=4911 RepID=A0ABX6EX79_KLUMA|nr:pre-mRNA-processing factor 31 [Kluyveromyces marxianus]